MKQSISFVVPMRNSSTTIIQALDSIAKQKYPIEEIIIIDNKSVDKSVRFVAQYASKSKIPITLFRRRADRGLSSSYNLGVKKAKSRYVVLMHSDSVLASVYELQKLTEPFERNPKIIASYGTVTLPTYVWNVYNFWQKCLFAQAVGVESAGLNGKFDCILRDIFLKVGGFDEINFGNTTGIGGEDADLHLRLQKEGEVVPSKAKVVHLHYLGTHYSLKDWIRTRKMLAKTYGQLIQLKKHFSIRDSIIFFIKPTLAVLPFIPHLHVIGILLLGIYPFLYFRKMYSSALVLRNPRIFILPFITIFLVYYETFWMIEILLFAQKKEYN